MRTSGIRAGRWQRRIPRARRGTALIGALLWLLSGCLGTAPSAPPLILGGTFNLSGQMGPYEQPVEKAVRLAIAQQNAAGGIHGRLIQFTAYDGASRAEQEQAATTAAINSGAVALIGFDDTSSLLNVAPLIQHAAIPYVSAGATSPLLLPVAGPSLFLSAFGDNMQAAASAEFAYDHLGSRRVGLLTNIGEEYSVGLSHYFNVRWRQLQPGGLVFSDTYQINDVDFSAQTGRLGALDPPLDALYVPATSPDELVALLPALRTAGFQGAILGGDSYDGAPIGTLQGQPMSQIYYTTHGQWPPAGPGPAQTFAAAYTQAYGQPPGTIFPALAYEGTQLLLDALTRAASSDPRAIRTALESTQQFAGLTGTLTYRPGSGGHLPNKPVTMMAIQGGVSQLAAIFTARTVPDP